MRQTLIALLVIGVMAGATGGVIAANGGGTGASGGSVAVAQYGHKTCAQLTQLNRAQEHALHKQHHDVLRHFHGKDRARLQRFFQGEERDLHRSHVTSEQRCRRNGGQ